MAAPSLGSVGLGASEACRGHSFSWKAGYENLLEVSTGGLGVTNQNHSLGAVKKEMYSVHAAQLGPSRL